MKTNCQPPNCQTDGWQLKTWILGTCLFLIPLISCSPEKDTRHIVFEIDGLIFTKNHFSEYMSRNVPVNMAELEPETVYALFDNFCDEKLLLYEASQHPIAERILTTPEMTITDLSVLQNDLLRDSYLSEVILADLTLEPYAIGQYYESHFSEYHIPRRAAVRSLVLAEEATLNNVLRILRNKEASFEELCIRFASANSDIGIRHYEPGTLPQKFEDAIFSLKPGGVSRPVETDFGFHLFELVRLEPAHVLTYEEASPSIERLLQEQMAERALKKHLLALKSKYKITRYRENLLSQSQDPSNES